MACKGSSSNPSTAPFDPGIGDRDSKNVDFRMEVVKESLANFEVVPDFNSSVLLQIKPKRESTLIASREANVERDHWVLARDKPLRQMVCVLNERPRRR
jgi:hypothetical protein